MGVLRWLGIGCVSGFYGVYDKQETRRNGGEGEDERHGATKQGVKNQMEKRKWRGERDGERMNGDGERRAE